MFKDAKLKIERANHHIANLSDELAAFTKTNFYSIRPYSDIETRDNLIKFKIHAPVPDSWGLIIGDAVHNLRAALDIAIGDLAGDPMTDFPFHEERDQLEHMLNKGKPKTLPDHIKAFILDVVQPYKAGNYPLWALNRLDRLDKHQLIIPSLTILRIIYFAATNHETGQVFDKAILQTVKGKALIVKLPPGKFEITNYGQPYLNIAFDKTQFFDGDAVIPTLTNISEMIAAILSSFESRIAP